MSKVFSVVEAYDSKGMQSVDFRVAGWVTDEDDFFDIEGMDEFYDEADGDIQVTVQTYCFGDGETEDADDHDMVAITEEFIDAECDCIAATVFVIVKEA